MVTILLYVSRQRMDTTPDVSIRHEPWLIMLLMKLAARSPCQVMSVLTSDPTALPMAV